MQEFYINVPLRQGVTCIEVDPVPPEGWSMRGTPEFVIEYDTQTGTEVLTIRLEHGIWYDRNTRLTDDEVYMRCMDEQDEGWNINYQSPLNSEELKTVGNAISNYMVVSLSAYMNLFIPQFGKPEQN